MGSTSRPSSSSSWNMGPMVWYSIWWPSKPSWPWDLHQLLQHSQPWALQYLKTFQQLLLAELMNLHTLLAMKQVECRTLGTPGGRQIKVLQYLSNTVLKVDMFLQSINSRPWDG